MKIELWRDEDVRPRFFCASVSWLRARRNARTRHAIRASMSARMAFGDKSVLMPVHVPAIQRLFFQRGVTLAGPVLSAQATYVLSESDKFAH